MTEIVRLTTQMHPLEMGVPLYPFSHSGVFPINKDGSAGTTPGAPLPDSSSFEDQQSVTSPSSLRSMVGGTPPMPAAAMHAPRGNPTADVASWCQSPPSTTTYMQNISRQSYTHYPPS